MLALALQLPEGAERGCVAPFQGGSFWVGARELAPASPAADEPLRQIVPCRALSVASEATELGKDMICRRLEH